MSNPRVLYLIDSLATGGAERSLVDMAPRLIARGIDLSVAVLIDRDGLTAELEAAGVIVHRVAGSNRLQWPVAVARLVRTQRPDLIHTTLFEADIAGRLAGTITGAPVVCTLATTPYTKAHAQEAGIRISRLWAAQLADALTARLVRRFHAVSQPVADACAEGLHLDPERIDVIPRGRDRGRLGNPGPERTRKARFALGIPMGRPVLLFAGRQEPAKGIEVLLRALPSLLIRVPDATLLLAGREGRTTSRMKELIEDLRLGEAVRVLGERNDVSDLMCAADVFVLPSYREGLPGAVIEAMAMHLPVVASDIPAVREAVPDEDHGYLVSPGDPIALSSALVAAITDTQEAGRRADRSAIRFEELFDLDTVAEEMADFYRRSLDR